MSWRLDNCHLGLNQIRDDRQDLASRSSRHCAINPHIPRAWPHHHPIAREEPGPAVPDRGRAFERSPPIRCRHATTQPSGTRQSNLPQQLTHFIGRQREIAQIRRLLTSTRLVTLTGPGGIGKTRLALQVAAEAESLHEYGDGVWFVEFASLSDPGLVPQTGGIGAPRP